jgi:hypothetical protein
MCRRATATIIPPAYQPHTGEREPRVIVGPIRVHGTRGTRVIGMAVGETFRRMSTPEAYRLIGALQAAIDDSERVEQAYAQIEVSA